MTQPSADMDNSEPAIQSFSTRGGTQTLRSRLLSWPNLIALAAALSLVYFLAARFEFDVAGTWEIVKANDFFWYVLAFVVFYLVFPLRGIRWRVLLEDSGCNGVSGPGRVSIARLAEVSFVGWFLNAVSVFRMGYLYRSYQLSSRSNSSFALVAGGLFAERILDTVITFALLVLAAGGLLGTQWNSVFIYVLLGALVTSLALGGAAVVMALAGVNPLRFLPMRFRPGYGSFRQGTLESFRRWPHLLALSTLIWACEAGRLLFVIQSLGLSVSPWLVLFVALGASMITHFPVTPGGLGLVEAGMTGLLATTLTAEQALSVALLDRSISYLSIVAFGGTWFVARSSPSIGRRLRGAQRLVGL